MRFDLLFFLLNFGLVIGQTSKIKNDISVADRLVALSFSLRLDESAYYPSIAEFHRRILKKLLRHF